MGFESIRRKTVAAVAGALALGAATTAGAQTLQMASLGPASPTTVFSIAVSEVLKDELDYRVQLATGSAATRQAVDAANQRLDLFTTAVSINHYMQTKTAMYADMDQAPELFSNLRAILNYPLGSYHVLVWADSGIESVDDIAGKTVFTGPPAGAARTAGRLILEGSAGLVAGEDYEEANLDWGSAEQAFQDRQVDVYIVPVPIPSGQIEQINALGEFRVLGIPDDATESEAIRTVTSIPGRGFAMLEPGAYSNLVNEEPARLLESMVGLGATKFMSEEMAYNITKAIFENNEDLVAAAKWMSVVTPENALAEMNMPLHPGALKYYREVGIEVPENLIPPEAM